MPFSIALGFSYLLLILAAFSGWVMNIITIFNSDFGNITTLLVLRLVGVVLGPIGAILGYV